jgi:hypothetical protein
LDDLADEGEADAGAFVVTFEAFEHVEDAVLAGGVDANAVILEPEADGAAGGAGAVFVDGLGPDADLREDTRGDEFDGVVEEVGEALGHGGLVAEDGGHGFLDVDFGPGRLELRVGLEEAAEERGGRNGGQFHLVENGVAVLEGIGDEMIHAFGGLIDAAEEVTAVGVQGTAVFLEEHAAEAAHGAEGGAHVVGDGVGEMFELIDHFLEPGGALLDEAFEFGGIALDLGAEAVAFQGFGDRLGDALEEVLVGGVKSIAGAAGESEVAEKAVPDD